MKTTSAFDRSRTRQEERMGKDATCSPLKKEVVRRSPMEPSGAVSVGYHYALDRSLLENRCSLPFTLIV